MTTQKLSASCLGLRFSLDVTEGAARGPLRLRDYDSQDRQNRSRTYDRHSTDRQVATRALGIVTKHIQSSTGEVTIDLGELALIGVEGVRFLNACEEQGIVVTNASPYVTDWMKQERMPADDDLC